MAAEEFGVKYICAGRYSEVVIETVWISKNPKQFFCESADDPIKVFLNKQGFILNFVENLNILSHILSALLNSSFHHELQFPCDIIMFCTFV